MTYDFYGSRPSRTNHHSPLYAPRKGVEGYDLDSSVKYLMEHHFVPAHKINIGLAFFGRSLKTKGKAKIHTVSYRKTDAKTFPEDKGAPAYYNILARQHHFKYHWDNYAEVPYLTGKKLRTFVTFDDEASIQKKGRYILENGLGGAIVWDLMSDYVESKHRSGVIASTPLASALKGSLCQEVYVQRPTATKLVQRTIVSIERLPQHWPSLAYQSFAPRLAIQPVLSKKEQKKKKRRERKRRKKQGVNHFDRV
jgi:GH18 family chitinase